METQKTHRSLHLLPQEIIEEILSTLDVKSLFRFRCVSKSYRSLIDSKRFIKTHLQTSRKDTSLAHHRVLLFPATDSPNAKVSGCSLLSFFDNSDYDAPELNFPTNVPSYSSISFVGCCNGLVCILLHINMNSVYEFILWNPSTRISKKLPSVDKNKIGWSNFQCLGFGWDESSDDYKVIAIVSVEGKTICKIYNLKTDSWKQINVCDIDRHWYWDIGKLASGKLHWDPFTRSCPNELEIVAFDLKREVFNIVEQPCYSGGIDYQCLGTFGECLAVQCCYNKGYDDIDEIWVMKEYGVKESWEKVMVLEYYYDRFGIWTSPLVDAFCIGTDREIILMKLEEKYLAYNVKAKKFHGPGITTSQFDIYIESLVSPLG